MKDSERVLHGSRYPRLGVSRTPVPRFAEGKAVNKSGQQIQGRKQKKLLENVKVNIFFCRQIYFTCTERHVQPDKSIFSLDSIQSIIHPLPRGSRLIRIMGYEFDIWTITRLH